MSKIINVHDSFLHFLADNLSGITVRELLFDQNDPTADVLQTNALNVNFISGDYDTGPSTVTVSLDVVNDDPLTGKSWEEQIANLLHATAMTEVIDYRSTPGSLQTQSQRMISWPSKVSFRPVTATSYYHSSATVTLTYS